MYSSQDPNDLYDTPGAPGSSQRRRKRRSPLPKLFAAGILLGAAIFFLPRIYEGFHSAPQLPQTLTDELKALADSQP